MTRGNARKPNGVETNGNDFQNEVKKQLKEILDSMKNISDQINEIKNELMAAKRDISKITEENNKLKQIINLNTFKVDSLEQYGRRENLRIYGIPESNENIDDDGEQIVHDIAKLLNVDLDNWDIQRAHRLGRKRSNKPRPIIVRFLSFKKRNEILNSKSKLKNNQVYPSAFITEDLTPLRSKLLYYVKHHCDEKFVMCHTRNGNILMKKSANYSKAQHSKSTEKVEGMGDWLVVSTPDDLFKLDIDVDFTKLNYKPLLFNLDLNSLK